MNFTPLTKERVRQLEVETTSYLNLLANGMGIDSDPAFIHNFHNWSDDDYNERGEPDGIFFRGLYEKVNYISKKLGMKQTYYVTHTCRNAIWGFEFKGKEFLLYYSNEGLTLQMLDTTTAKEVLDCIEAITNKWRA